MRRWLPWSLSVLVGCSSVPTVTAVEARRPASDSAVTTTTPAPPPVSTTPVTSVTPTSTSVASGPRTAPGDNGVGDELFPALGFTGIDVVHYDVDLAYDPATDRVAATVVVDLLATGALTEILLDTDPAIEIATVTLDGQAVAFEHAGAELAVTLPVPVVAGTPLAIAVSYAVTPSASASPPAGLPTGWFNTDGGSYVLNEPDAAHTWLPCNDHPSDKATWTFRLTVPDGLAGVANGELVDRIAGTGEETFVWEQRQPMATYLAQVLTGDYVLIDDVTADGLPLTSAVLSSGRDAAQPYLDLIDEQIAFFEERFGPYPLDRYGLAITDSVGGLAMETQGRSLFSRDDLSGDMGFIAQLLLAHELAHQWFGDAVTPARWRDIWLNEAFATYGQWLWLDHVGMLTVDDEAENHLVVRQYSTVATGEPRVADLFGYESYDGGAVVVHALRRELGDEMFFSLLQRWVADNEGTSRTTADFVALAEDVAGRSLSTFFDEWLFSADLPDEFPD